MCDTRNEDVLKAWAESAQYWDRHYQTVRSMFAPVTDALIATARIALGYRVLDVSGGAGEPSLTIAEKVGPAGSVAYSDPIEGMMAIAQRQARSRGLANISFHCAPAESLPFPEATFDCVTCRFGSMFFADPLLGAKEILRVLKPGGTVALAVWRHREFNPFFAIVADVVGKYIEQVPDDPDAPGAFRFANPGSLPRVLMDAGGSNVSESILEFPARAEMALDDFWKIRVELSETLRGKVAKLTPAQLDATRHEVTAAAALYFKNGTVNIPAQALIVRASRD